MIVYSFHMMITQPKEVSMTHKSDHPLSDLVWSAVAIISIAAIIPILMVNI